jgi:hypothetical protein
MRRLSDVPTFSYIAGLEICAISFIIRCSSFDPSSVFGFGTTASNMTIGPFSWSRERTAIMYDDSKNNGDDAK